MYAVRATSWEFLIRVGPFNPPVAELNSIRQYLVSMDGSSLSGKRSKPVCSGSGATWREEPLITPQLRKHATDTLFYANTY
jgi:hypothetical protein